MDPSYFAFQRWLPSKSTRGKESRDLVAWGSRRLGTLPSVTLGERAVEEMLSSGRDI